MQLNGNVEKFIKDNIYHWVGKNFGSQEAEDPSWNIEALSEYLTKKLYKEYGTPCKKYELTLLLDTECDVDKAVDKIEKHIKEINHGMVFKRDNEGKKRLAYSIQGKEYANYYYLEIGLPTTSEASVLSSWLNINDDILRYLLVIQDTRR